MGKKRGGKAKCILNWEDLVDWSDGLIAVLIPDTADDACALPLRHLWDSFGDRAYLALTLRRRPIDEAGFRRERHADRYLKPPQEVARLFARYPEAVARTIEIAGRCTFSMDELAYQYPEERTMHGLTPQQALEKLTWESIKDRYPEGLPDEVKEKLDHELTLIQKLGYPRPRRAERDRCPRQGRRRPCRAVRLCHACARRRFR